MQAKISERRRMMLNDDVSAMTEVERNAGRLFLHQHPWSTWSYDLNFAGVMREKDDVYETKGTQCRIPMTVNCKERGSVNLNSVCIVEDLREWFLRQRFVHSSCRCTSHKVCSEGLEKKEDSMANEAGSRS